MTTPTGSGADQGELAPPWIQVVKGTPTDEEVAALVAVLATLQPSAARSTPARSSTGSGWSAYWRSVRAPLTPGPGSWRASGRLD